MLCSMCNAYDLYGQMHHKYFFSSESLSWLGAEVECQNMGGELLNIGGQREQNCLMKYAHSNEDANLLESFYWTDGRGSLFTT